jgi:hypothetical protein
MNYENSCNPLASTWLLLLHKLSTRGLALGSPFFFVDPTKSMLLISPIYSTLCAIDVTCFLALSARIRCSWDRSTICRIIFLVGDQDDGYERSVTPSVYPSGTKLFRRGMHSPSSQSNTVSHASQLRPSPLLAFSDGVLIPVYSRWGHQHEHQVRDRLYRKAPQLSVVNVSACSERYIVAYKWLARAMSSCMEPVREMGEVRVGPGLFR